MSNKSIIFQLKIIFLRKHDEYNQQLQDAEDAQDAARIKREVNQ
jgi:hypothetical protein